MSMILSLSTVSFVVSQSVQGLTWGRVVLQQAQQLDLHPWIRHLVVDVFRGQVSVEHDLLR